MFATAVFLGIAGIFVLILVQAQRFTKGRDLDAYRLAHPECVKAGKVTCHHCGGNSLYLRKVGSVGMSVLNSHVCRQCGQELYRSKT